MSIDAEDQLGAIVGRDEAHAVGQRAASAICCFERVDHLERVGADAHHDDAADGLAAAVPVRRAAANLGTELHGRDVPQPDRRAAGRHRDDALLEVRRAS